MLEFIIKTSLERRSLVFFAVLFLVGLGFWNFTRLPIDAVPDITNIQVVVNTQAPGYTPLEVEQRVTFPLENIMAGLSIPGQHRAIVFHRLRSFLRKVPIFILLGSK